MKKIKYFILFILIILCINVYTYERVFYGIASFYGKKFHGKRTASGEIFDMNKFTAAHKTLPLGSIVKVTNLANNKNIVVKINDRGPYVGNRVIDLSMASAKNLNYINQGLTRVKVEVIYLAPDRRNYNPSAAPVATNEDDANSSSNQGTSNENENFTPPVTPPVPTPAPNEQNQSQNSEESIAGGRILRIQLGAYNSKENAEKWISSLKQRGVEAEIVEVRSADNNFYKVYSLEKFRNLNKAFQVLKEIRSKRIECFIIGQYYARSSE